MHLCEILPNFKTMNKQMLINYTENWGSSLFIKCIHDSNQSVTSDQFNPLQSDLRNQSNIFSVDRCINQKRTENCINARSAFLQKFSVLFSVDTSINRKKYQIDFLSFNFHCLSTKKTIILTLLNVGLFPKFDVIKIHVMSQ